MFRFRSMYLLNNAGRHHKIVHTFDRQCKWIPWYNRYLWYTACYWGVCIWYCDIHIHQNRNCHFDRNHDKLYGHHDSIDHLYSHCLVDILADIFAYDRSYQFYIGNCPDNLQEQKLNFCQRILSWNRCNQLNILHLINSSHDRLYGLHDSIDQLHSHFLGNMTSSIVGCNMSDLWHNHILLHNYQV